jgi:hypothetical protein
VVLAISNTSTGNGVTGGGIYPDTLELDHQPQQLREMNVNATQRDAIA